MSDWTTSKAEANKLVDELSEVCFEYGKNENNEKLLDVFYKTKALKNYVGIMQGLIDVRTARIAELKELLDTESQLSNQFYLLLVDNPKSKKLADDLIEALRINGKEVQE